MWVLHLLGSAMLIVFLAFIIANTMVKGKKADYSELAGRLLLVVLLFLMLLRT